MDYKSQRQSEVENLARTLKASKLAHSESEARRMAEEMLSTSKKVADDFSRRDKEMYGNQPKNSEVENAHKILEQITGNITKGRSNVRIDIKELDLEKPLRELIPQEEESHEPDDDGETVEVNELQFPSIHEPEKKHLFEAGTFDEGDEDDDSEEEKDPTSVIGSEEEKEPSSVIFTQEEAKEESDEEDFSVKELSSAPPSKSEEERKRELAKMEESKVDLSKIFGHK